MTDLARKKCVACNENTPPLTPAEIERYHQDVPDWTVIHEEGEPRLRRVYQFKGFAPALAFTNRVGQAAEEEDHHPALLTEWGKVTVTWWTHRIKGLHQNDFIMAAKTDQIFGGTN
jgi:4a-hydroxytetrahydrobiopterin dehydratase